MAMQLPKLFRSGRGGSGGSYPRILQENLGGILTEGGQFLAQEGVDDPTVVDLPCIAFFHAASLGLNGMADGDPVFNWPNIAPGRTERAGNPSSDPANIVARFYSDVYGGRVQVDTGTVVEPFNRIGIDPAISFETLDSGNTPLGFSAFMVCSLDTATQGVLFGFDLVNGMLLGELTAPTRDFVYVDTDPAFVSAALMGTQHVGGWAAYVTPSSRALLEYRVNYTGGSWHQSLFVNGRVQATQTLATGGLIPPQDRTINQMGAYYIGNLWQFRAYSTQLSDADQLAVRREMCNFYGLPCYTDL
jgi:hypothetical protein